MVATRSAHGVARAAAAIFTLLLIVPTLPPAAAQTEQLGTVYVTQGTAEFFQASLGSGKTPTQFITNDNDQTTLRVPVYNTGPAVDNVAVYFWFTDEWAPARSDCVTVNLASGTGNSVPRQPAVAYASFTFQSKTLATQGYNITAQVGGVQPHQVSKTCTGTSPLTLDPDPELRAIQAYFVKGAKLDLRITGFRWCSGPTVPRTDCTPVGGTTNLSRTTGSTQQSYFELDVENHGTWANLSDFGGPNRDGTDGLRVVLNVSIRGAFIPGSINVTNPNASVFNPRSAVWPFLGKAGDYNVTTTLDPVGALRGAIPQHTGQNTVNVGFRDYVPTILPDGLKTSAADPYTTTNSTIEISGNVAFRNLGRQDFENLPDPVTGVDRALDVKWRVYIQNDSRPFRQSQFNVSGSNTTLDGFASWTVPFSWEASTVPGDENYLEPGRHTIRAEIDSIGGDYSLSSWGTGWNVTFELEEANNNATLDIFVGGGTGPTFTTPVPKLSLGAIGLPAMDRVRPHELFNVFVNVTDVDPSKLTVVGNFSRVDNASDYRLIPFSYWETASAPFIGQILDFNFTNDTTGEEWRVRVTATDVFGRSANSSYANFRLVPWDVHNATREFILDPANSPEAQQITWSDSQQPTWIIKVLANATGIEDQRTNVTNIGLDVTTPKNRTYVGDGDWSPVPSNCAPGPLGIGEVCDVSPDQFKMIFLKGSDDGGPGRWNYSVRVHDLASITRYINGSFLIADELPEITERSLAPSVVDPLQNFTVKANFTDDFSVKAAHVNFTRTVPNDGLVVNLTLRNMEDGVVPGGGRSYYRFNDTIETGRGKHFGIGGTFDAKLWVVDENDNWNWSSLGSFTLNDTDQPTLVDAAATPAVQEVGANVTFSARARDTTNVSVKLQVLRLSEEMFPAVTLTEGVDGVFSYTTNFSVEDTFDWIMTASDSTGRDSEVKRGTITVRSNLGPRFDIRSPSTVIDGTRYGTATPRIELAVHDTEGVLPGSIDMRVGGVAVTPDIVPATGSQGGYIVSYTVTAAKKFSHRDVVEVNLSAVDNSTENLVGTLNFTFVVDDVSPVARIVGISPSYRDQPSQPLNISLASRITLAADDSDGVPTETESIRFRILGGGNNAAETVYTGPFRITDAPGVYTGPRLYQIQFWAEDSVGNFNRNFNVTTVFVDDTPPALFQFFPQGRQINATFVDDRVGVNRSVAWYRVNNEPYVPLPLVEDAGTWAITLPEGKKGDRISYYLQVWDRLDNTDTFGNATAPYASFDVSNHEPKVRIRAPTEGARLGRSVDLMWDASDEDNDALVFTLYYKPPGKPNFVELARLENTDARRYAIDTQRFPDGQYTIRVAASDGGFVKLSDVTVTILNRGSAVGSVNVDGGRLPGETALVTAEITKAQATVEARIYLDGEFVDAYPMNDDGADGDAQASDGIYSARVPISAAGDYRVEIFSRYQEDGELKESTLVEAASFSAALTPGYILAEYAAILVLIAILAVIGIGVAVFVLVRRR